MRRTLAAALVAVAALTGCTGQPKPTPTPTPTSASPTQRPFTVTTTARPTVFDPAAAATDGDAIVALNVFQRLMVVHPMDGSLKPDAAQDCLFTSPTVYQCTLVKDLTFSNGHKLDAAAVKFSIDRAIRLNVAGTAVPLFSSVQSVEAPDAETVRFNLFWPDTQIGQVLATAAAGIVDPAVYSPDEVAAPSVTPVGSGPFTVQAVDEGGVTFAANEKYQGAQRGNQPVIRLATVADSTAAEEAIRNGTTDVVWGSLDAAAVGRVRSNEASGFRPVGLDNTEMTRLVWNPASPSRMRPDVRAAIAGALQGDRTLASLLPPSMQGSTPAFAIGGRPSAPPVVGSRLNLTLTYRAAEAGMGDLARLLRDRIEASAGVSVLVKPDAPGADLALTSAQPWLDTPEGWLQAYLAAPLPGTETKLGDLAKSARQPGDAALRLAALAEIQHQAGTDLTVLPISMNQETFFVSQNTRIIGDPYGSGWQLGLWGFGR